MQKLFYVALILTIAGIIFFAVYLYGFSMRESRDETLTAPMAPMQKNIAWEKKKEEFEKDPINTIFSPSDGTDGGIFVRQQQNDLLVKFGNPQEFYKYDAETENIVSVSESDWRNGKSEIACRERDYVPRSLIQLDETKAIVYVWEGGRKIPTFGKFALGVLESPKHDLAVVLSSDGYRSKGTPGFIFGGNGGETFGNRFVRILDLTTMDYITQPLGLTAVNEPPTYYFCWTDDERYVLAYEVEYKSSKFGITDSHQFDLDFHIIKINR